MPELPDVEIQRRYLERTSKGQRIEDVLVRDDYILRGFPEGGLKTAIKGRCILAGIRHGKYLFAKLDSDDYLLFHFGMDGGLAYLKTADYEPTYSRVVICFENGCSLSYVSLRKLGQMGIVHNVDQFIRNKGLGPDALSVGCLTLTKALAKSNAAAKAVLMNQRTVAGIGNIYADEILFQSHINPRSQFGTLSEHKLATVFWTMRDILETAIRLEADSRRFPDSWIIHHRHPGARCPRCGACIVRTKISGRTTYYCSECQK